MKKITEFKLEPLDRHPQLVQHFVSLEGEGGTIGRSALYIRTGECSLRCNFCFGSPKGKREPLITTLNKKRKKLTNIKVGDKLLTYNNDQELVETEVYNIIDRVVNNYLLIKIDGKKYHVTPEHPFFTTNGLKRADELKIGDDIIHGNGYEYNSLRMKINNPMFNTLSDQKRIKNTDWLKLRENISKTRLKRFEEGTLLSSLQTQDQKDKASKRMIENNPMKNPLTTNKMSKTLKQRFTDNELIPYHRDENWRKNSETLRKNIESHNFRKSKVEEYFHELCETNDIILDFVGSNKLIIGNKCPDFLIPGTKKIIEIYDSSFLYTDCYRDRNWEISRITHFKKHGYECLCIDMYKFKLVKDRASLLKLVRDYYHNGKIVESIKLVNKDLKVYNISCTPYNTYLIDDMWVHNCDTAYSVEGKEEHNIIDMISEEYVDLLISSYSIAQRKNITNCSITGGEPLLNINYMNDIINQTKKAFPYIDQIIFETNGTMLSVKDNCFKLIDQIGKLFPSIKFMLSISPKLSGKISYSSLLQDNEVLEVYKSILDNYHNVLDAHFDLQLKFVHSDSLLKYNEPLIEYATSSKHDHKLSKNQILIMPFTPVDPLVKDKDAWEKSKDSAANYAIKNFFRYSPRVHVDRRLD